MIKIIINADDLGANKIINNEIERFIKNGLISSATIMANGLDFNGVEKIVRLHPEISFGAHLNLVEFSSLTKSAVFRKYGLTDSNDNFIYQKIFDLHFTDELLHAIKLELIAQIQKIKDSGINISHFDGHQHCHSIYEIYPIIIQLTKEFKINKIRRKIPPISPFKHILNIFYKKQSGSNIEIVSQYDNKKNSRKTILNYVKRYVQAVIWNFNASKEFKLTDSFYSYEQFCILAKNKKVVNKTIELMCHPGLDEFNIESKSLEKNELDNYIDSYILISYLDI